MDKVITRSWNVPMLLGSLILGVLLELLAFLYLVELGWTVEWACPVGFISSATAVWGFWRLATARRRDQVPIAALKLGSFGLLAGLAYFFKAGVLTGAAELLGLSTISAAVLASISGWGLVIAGILFLGRGATTASQRRGSQVS